MTNNLLRFFFFAVPFFFLLGACNDPVSIDSGLLEEDQINLKYSEDFELEATSVLEDSVLTYSTSGSLARYPCGNFDDPVFGKSTAQIFGQLRLPIPANFDGASYDSLVLSLAYDSDLPSYGDITQPFEYEIFRLSEGIDSTLYYSSASFETDMFPIGSTSFVPQPSDSVDIVLYSTDSTFTFLAPPHVRIPIMNSVGNELIGLDSAAYSSNIDFLDIFKGINIKPTSDNPGLLNFNLISQFSRLTLYYRQNSDTLEYNYYFSELAKKMSSFDNDYSGSIVEPFINNNTLGDSLLFAQGMSGLNTRITLPDLATLSNTIINKAEIEFYVADLAINDTITYPPTSQFIVAEESDEGAIILIQDANDAIFRANLGAFGGDLKVDAASGLKKYTVNITSHLQDMVNGTASDYILIRAFPKESTVSRSIFFGPKHSTYPMKLKLTYTDL